MAVEEFVRKGRQASALILALLGVAGCVFDKTGTAPLDGDVTPICGDGLIGSGEACDDGNSAAGDGCAPGCQVEQGWVCNGEPSICTSNCGDGLVDVGELCDDGNAIDDDGCNTFCQVESGWQCSGVPSVCTSGCGDGIIGVGEICDDGNLVEDDGCSTNCQVEAGFECAGLPSVCAPTCGDGVVVGGEPCDDGNQIGGDGCSASCLLEGWRACYGEPSQCVCTVYVSVSSAEFPTGESWSHALNSVQAGIDEAVVRAVTTGTCEVWIAGGRYHIYESSEDDTVQVASDVTMYGGFSGQETWRSQRNPVLNETFLDGSHATNPSLRVRSVLTADAVLNSGLDGLTVINGGVSGGLGGGLFAMASDLSIYFCRFEQNTATAGGGIYLDGGQVSLLATHFADNTAQEDGAGAYLGGGAPSIDSCTFSGNQAVRDGGGVLSDTSTATFNLCLFQNNTAGGSGGGIMVLNGAPVVQASEFDTNTATYGGGIRVLDGAADILATDFWGNVASARGGAVHLHEAISSVTNCSMWMNSAAHSGGGLRANYGTLLLTNSILRDNEASLGGGLYAYETVLTDVVNCTFFANRALGASGSVIGIFGSSAVADVTNSILWGSGETQIAHGTGTVTVSYCDVQGAFVGVGNIDASPIFVDGANGDVRLQAGSPCIDAADGSRAPGLDSLGLPRFDDPTVVDSGVGVPSFVDLGAHERQP